VTGGGDEKMTSSYTGGGAPNCRKGPCGKKKGGGEPQNERISKALEGVKDIYMGGEDSSMVQRKRGEKIRRERRER